MRLEAGFVVVLLSTICGALGCATLPACPAKGGPTWRELTSLHFNVRSDLSEEEGRELTLRLEELRAAMLATLWPGAPEPPNRTKVVILRSRLEFLVYVRDPRIPPSIWGIKSQRPPLPATLVFSGTDRRTMMVLVHELAHDLSEWFLPTQPLWYSEGIATFLETLTYDREAGRAEIGEPSPVRYQVLQRSHRLPASALLSGRTVPGGEGGGIFEDNAWLLMHYLINKRPRDLARLQVELGHLKPAAEAWSIAMPDLPPEKLNTALDEYSSSGTYGHGSLALRIPAPAIAVRIMTDAEAHATRALLFETAASPDVPPEEEAAKEEIAQALEADATNVEALAYRSLWFTPEEQHVERAELARRAATAHPEDWLAWSLVAAEANDPATERTALVRALRVDPNQLWVLVGLAKVNADAGRWQEALSFSTKAMHLGGRSGLLLRLHTRALAHVGQCRDAAYFIEALKALALPAEVAADAREWPLLQRTCADAAARAASASGEAEEPR